MSVQKRALSGADPTPSSSETNRPVMRKPMERAGALIMQR